MKVNVAEQRGNRHLSCDRFFATTFLVSKIYPRIHPGSALTCNIEDPRLRWLHMHVNIIETMHLISLLTHLS